MLYLMSPRQQGYCGACIAGVISKGSDTLSRRVGKEFDVVQYAVAAGESIKIMSPAFLAFIAVTKLNVRVNQRD